jgi:hypothetical protein
MRTIFYLFLSLIMVMACASQPAKVDRIPNKRIVKRDLTRLMPVRYKVPSVPDLKDITKEPVSKKVTNTLNGAQDGVMPQLFVEFKNESYQLYDVAPLKGFIDKGDKGAHVFVVGHSHGKSGVGTLRLASQRAKTIQKVLEERGFKNVYVMASWGNKGIDFAPGRGVHLYVVGSIENSEGIPLILAKTTEGNNEGNKDNWQTAAIAADRSGKGM